MWAKIFQLLTVLRFYRRVLVLVLVLALALTLVVVFVVHFLLYFVPQKHTLNIDEIDTLLLASYLLTV